jgi:hypothetical protein
MKTHGVLSITPRLLYPRYPLDRRLGGPQSRSRRCGVQNNILPLPRVEPRLLGRPTRSTSLYRLRFLEIVGTEGTGTPFVVTAVALEQFTPGRRIPHSNPARPELPARNMAHEPSRLSLLCTISCTIHRLCILPKQHNYLFRVILTINLQALNHGSAWLTVLLPGGEIR